MEELLSYQCIDFKKLLMLKGKSLKLSDGDCYLLLLMMTMEDMGMKPINPQSMSKLSSLSIKDLDKQIVGLLDRHIIDRFQGTLSLKPLYDLLLKQPTNQKNEVNLIALFEDAFGRTLSQIECQIIQSMKSSGYDDQMIIDALNEAVKSGALSFRYIEKVLDNWSKYGVSKRYAPMEKKTIQQFDEQVMNMNWWD